MPAEGALHALYAVDETCASHRSRRILHGIILHMEAFQFHELVEAEATERLSLARVLPACPGEVLPQLASEHLSGRRITGLG